MSTKKQQALKLRLQGKSYTQITIALGVPKSTQSNWFSGLVLSDMAQSKINKRAYRLARQALIKRNKSQTHRARERMRALREQGSKDIQKITPRDLRVIGVALYWAEGYKRLQIRHGKERTYHPVALANSDPRLIQIFLRFLREICGVIEEDIHIDLRLVSHMNEKALKRFWQNKTGLPEKNFGKTYYGVSKSSLDKRPFNRLPYGTALIRINNTRLFHTIMGWIEGVARQDEYHKTD